MTNTEPRSRLDEIEKRFWSRVEQTEGCWIWRGLRSELGYGLLKVNGRQVKAHRVAYELMEGRIPEGKMVNHHCDNPPCVLRSHLYVGTAQDNALDRERRGRGRDRRGPRPEVRGTRNGNAKLDEATVAAIRAAVAGGESRGSVARRLGLHHGTVGRIVAGRTWTG